CATGNMAAAGIDYW
nr:immunoglobulin heavy chain junction region [Macaca mulatta]MOW98277.1 immunoglobulin heavy chain junction region [Macaca mulatta]MOW98522.1 immunoglobulin heavy chain junction region [Macaca mulatta]MOW99015.1 immunoglobulin heavy chain junction region [Macaca mulatta]MOW99430.1 immunoglobulin heavy chain junction region [Macaca mulatta]